MTAHLLRDLERVKKDLLDMGAVVEQAADLSIRAIAERRADLAGQVIAGDDEVVTPEPSRWMSQLEAEEEFALHRRDFADELRAAHVRLAPSRAHAAALAAAARTGPGEIGDLGDIGVAYPPLLNVPERLASAPVPGG